MLTPAQILQVKSANAGPNPSQPMNPDQAKASFGASTSTPAPNMLQRVSGDIKQAGEGVYNAVAGEGKYKGDNPITRGFEAGGEAASGITNVATDVLPGQGTRDVAKAVLKAPGDVINWLGTQIGSTQAAQDFVKNHPQATDALIQASKIGTSAGNVAGTILGAKGVAEDATGAVKNVANKVSETIKSPETTPETAAQTANTEAKANAMKAHDLIDKEVRNTAEKYGDVGKALNHAEVTKGSKPIDVLASYPEGKALPTMSKLGKMDSLPAINYLRTQLKSLGKIKGDLVDTANKNISVDDLQSKIESRIDASKGASDAMKKSTKADVAKEMDNLRETYKNGIPTEQLDKLKTEHANESSSYKTTGFPSRFNPDTHSLISKTAGDLVKEHGGEAPIDEMNKWITSHHDAIKVLEKMHGKTPHGGMFSRHVGGIAGEVAGLAGGMALGHPFLGAMAGRGASEIVNNILSSHFISNPLKRSIIDTMKDAPPEVIQKAKDFLSESEGKPQAEQTTPSSPKVEAPTSPTSIASPEEKATELPPREHQDESTLSFIKNNIGSDQRGMFSFGGKQKLSPRQITEIKSQIKVTQDHIDGLRGRQAPGTPKPSEAYIRGLQKRIDSLKLLLR